MKIMTDTGSLLSIEKARQLDVELIPLQVEIKGKNYRDYFEISSQDYIQAIQSAIPQSSQPAIGDVMKAFEAHPDGLYIAMTSGLSSTFVSAKALMTSDFPSLTVFNSKTLAGTQQYLVELAARLSSSLDKDAIIERMEQCLSQCKSYLIPVDFDYLKRNGRLSGMAAMMSGLLKIKPIVFHIPGMEKLEKFGVARTWSHAIDDIISDMKKAQVQATHKVYVSHGDNLPVAQLFKQKLEDAFANIEVVLNLLSPVMITQGGPGCVSVQYILKDDR